MNIVQILDITIINIMKTVMAKYQRFTQILVK